MTNSDHTPVEDNAPEGADAAEAPETAAEVTVESSDTAAAEPAEEVSADAPAEEVPVEEAVAEAPVEEATAEAPVEEAVAEAPTETEGQNEGAPVEETPAPETVVADAPVEEAPAEELPAAGAAADDAPAEEATAAPAEDASEEPAGDTTTTPVDETPAEGTASATEPAIAEAPDVDATADGAATAATAAAGEPITTEWGRVDEAGVVSVREGDEWRVVGEYPDGTPQEALAYFERKFDDLALRVRTLAQRRLRGGASAGDLRGQARKLKEEVTGADVVGDIAGLNDLLDALNASLSEASAEEAAAHRAAVDEAVAQRTAIVERVEALAARDPKSIQWKQATTDLNAAFEEWQQHQQSAPRLPKATGQALWKRFRDARSTVERHRRAFFAELDETHKSARDAKTRILAKAEALAPKGEDGIPAYRALLDEWKAAGRAGRKVDDALWARFKAAGDALYGARAERDAAEQAESAPRIEARKALLEEAKAVADTADLKKARQLLTGLQRRWDEVGRIFPRDVERGLDDQMRRVETDLRAREDVEWKRNNPETKARANDATRQLEEAIEKLEQEIAAAQAKGDKKAEQSARDALDARRLWLKAIGG